VAAEVTVAGGEAAVIVVVMGVVTLEAAVGLSFCMYYSLHLSGHLQVTGFLFYQPVLRAVTF